MPFNFNALVEVSFVHIHTCVSKSSVMSITHNSLSESITMYWIKVAIFLYKCCLILLLGHHRSHQAIMICQHTETVWLKSNSQQIWNSPFIFYSLLSCVRQGERVRERLLNFKLPDKLYCGKVPFLGLHEGATSENGLLACEKKTRNIPGSLWNIVALWEFV